MQNDLTHIFQNAVSQPSEIGLLVIDVQERFAAPHAIVSTEKTHNVAQKIAKIAPAFRAEGVQLYDIYNLPKYDRPDPYLFTPDVAHDEIVIKRHKSVYKDDVTVKSRAAEMLFQTLLDQTGTSLLLACGFYLGHCVEGSVKDAREHEQDVILLSDLCANNALFEDHHTMESYERLRDAGAVIADSHDVLRHVRELSRRQGNKPR